MDEVPWTFDVPSNKTVGVKGAKTIMMKTSGTKKTHYTVVLVCCANGRKLPPLLMFKRKTLPENVIPHGLYIHVYSKGWMENMILVTATMIFWVSMMNKLYYGC
jgi:hypothetical protein